MKSAMLGWIFGHVRLPGWLASIWFGWYLNALAREQGYTDKITRRRVE